MRTTALVITTADHKTIEVEPNLQYTLEFESTLRRNRSWGGLAENGMRLLYFRAWHSAKRTGKTDQSWIEFTEGPDAALDVSVKHDDDDDATADDTEEADPLLGKGGRTDQPTS